MKFFKIIKDNIKFIGVATSDDFRYFQQKHKLILPCGESKVQYIVYNGEFYKDYWMLPSNNNSINYSMASITAINEDSYNTLKQAIDNNKDTELIFQNEENLEEATNSMDSIQQVYPEIENPTISFVRELKMKEMKLKCKQAIILGIDVALQSGVIEHFDLTIEDQINLNSLRYDAFAEETQQLAFHCKDGEFRYYSKNDMLKIITTMDNHILYHNSYFNSLKKYINSLNDYEIISSIKYGDDFPQNYKSEVLLAFKN